MPRYRERVRARGCHDKVVPRSMMQVGNFHGEEPLRSAEERTHFSLWARAWGCRG